MEKITLYVGLLFATLTTLSPAVEPDASQMRMGIQGGLSFANASAPTDLSTSSQTGIMVGINLNVPVFQALSFQPEFMFAQRRANLANGYGYNLTGKYNSLEIPALLRATFGENVHPYVFLGPVAILNISNSYETSGPGGTTSLSFQPRTFDFAGDLGVGLDWGPVFGNLRYSLGLLDFDKSHVGWKSNGLQMLIGMNL